MGSKLAQRRYRANRLEQIKHYQELEYLIKRSQELRKEGKIKEADDLEKELTRRLKADNVLIQTELDELNARFVREFDKRILPKEGGILAENDLVLLKAISRDDYELYRKLSFKCSDMGEINENENHALFNSYMAEHNAYYNVIDKASGEFAGYISIKDFREAVWEIAIELLEAFRNRGYGYSSLKLFLESFYSLTGEAVYRFRIDPDNYASQALVKRIGAEPKGTSEYTLHGEVLEKFKKENVDLIDEDFKRVAGEFHVEPEELLGLVLEYRINMHKVSEAVENM